MALGHSWLKWVGHSRLERVGHSRLELVDIGLNEWGIHGLNGWGFMRWSICNSNEWGSYCKVRYCFLQDMLKKKQVSTLSSHHLTTGFDPFELPTRDLLQKGQDHSPP